MSSIVPAQLLQALAAEPTDDFFRTLADALPAAVYTTDAEGRLTYFNDAAADLWGHRPVLGVSEWCGSWKLYWPDGSPLPHDQCPMAVAVRERRAVRGMEAIAERPDGTRIPFIPLPTPLYDVNGRFAGAVNVLVDISDRKASEEAMRRLVAIVESSDDAIVSKRLDGTITSWNRGAERLFGYLAEEIVGRSIKTLIPSDNHAEEDTIIDRIRRDQPVEHYETVRQRKDGSLVDISLTVSPIKDGRGVVIGASSIARDISQRKRAEQQIATLAREAEHRTKNLLATVLATVRLTRADTVEAFTKAIDGRIRALAQVNSLFASTRWSGAELRTLTEQELSPYAEATVIEGPVTVLKPDIAQAMAMVVHELATNAVKYGALSTPNGSVRVSWRRAGSQLRFTWVEMGGPSVEAPERQGFGTQVMQSLVADQLKGDLRLDWKPTGLCCEVVIDWYAVA